VLGILCRDGVRLVISNFCIFVQVSGMIYLSDGGLVFDFTGVAMWFICSATHIG
jgi:hypothetical protein